MTTEPERTASETKLDAVTGSDIAKIVADFVGVQLAHIKKIDEHLKERGVNPADRQLVIFYIYKKMSEVYNSGRRNAEGSAKMLIDLEIAKDSNWKSEFFLTYHSRVNHDRYDLFVQLKKGA